MHPRITLGAVTDPYIPIVPGSSPPTLGQMLPAPQPPRRPRWVWPVAAAMLLAAVAIVATTVYLAVHNNPTAPATNAITPPAVPAAVEPQAARIWPEPLAANITLTVKVLEQKCFGSAGCNVTYTVDVSYSGSPLEPGKDWDITYAVTGGDDPQINTLVLAGTVDGYSYTAQREERISIPKSSSKLTAKVTAVSAH